MEDAAQLEHVGHDLGRREGWGVQLSTYHAFVVLHSVGYDLKVVGIPGVGLVCHAVLSMDVRAKRGSTCALVLLPPCLPTRPMQASHFTPSSLPHRPHLLADAAASHRLDHWQAMGTHMCMGLRHLACLPLCGVTMAVTVAVTVTMTWAVHMPMTMSVTMTMAVTRAVHVHMHVAVTMAVSVGRMGVRMAVTVCCMAVAVARMAVTMRMAMLVRAVTVAVAAVTAAVTGCDRRNIWPAV